ncbi:MAG: hypothetical protein QOE36_3567 [Gaiellaceae bacterium]|jgi:hypothetical protein|nr:hypothetical protein [Gaiellaceae bacterium]
MRRLALTLFLEVLVATGVLVPLLLSPVRRGPLLEVYVLVLGGLVLLTTVVATRRATEADDPRASEFLRSLVRPEHEPERPRDLGRLEREVFLATSNAHHFHQRLRPTLRELAAQRLADRQALDLESCSPEVRAALGPAGWELLVVERQQPTDPRAEGIPLAELTATVEALERI